MQNADVGDHEVSKSQLLHAWISFDSLLSAMSGLPQLAVGVKSASRRLIGNLGRVHLAGSRKRRHGNRLGPSELPDEAAPSELGARYSASSSSTMRLAMRRDCLA